MARGGPWTLVSVKGSANSEALDVGECEGRPKNTPLDVGECEGNFDTQRLGRW